MSPSRNKVYERAISNIKIGKSSMIDSYTKPENEPTVRYSSKFVENGDELYSSTVKKPRDSENMTFNGYYNEED